MEKIEYSISSEASQYFARLIERFLQCYEGNAQVGRNLLVFTFEFKNRISRHAFGGPFRLNRETDENLPNRSIQNAMYEDNFSSSCASETEGEEQPPVADEIFAASRPYLPLQLATKERTEEGTIITNIFYSLINQSTRLVHPCFRSLVHDINQCQNPMKLQLLKEFFLKKPEHSLVEIVSFLSELRKELTSWGQLERCTLLGEFKQERDTENLKARLMAEPAVKEELSWFSEEEFTRQIGKILHCNLHNSFEQNVRMTLESLKELKVSTQRWKKYQKDASVAGDFYFLRSKKYFGEFCNLLGWLLENPTRNLVAFYSNFFLHFGSCEFAPRSTELIDPVQKSLARYFWIWELEFVPKGWRRFSIPLGNLILYQKILISVLYLDKLYAKKYKCLALNDRLNVKQVLHRLSFGLFHRNLPQNCNFYFNESEILLQLLQLFEKLSQTQ